MKLALIPLYAIVLPFLLWPLELFLPYPHIMEEVAKALLIYFIATKKLKISKKVTLVIIVGTLFTLSESVLYLFNIYYLGTIQTFFKRLLLTGSLHIITSLVILISSVKDKRLIVAGVLLAIVIHLYFNIAIASF